MSDFGTGVVAVRVAGRSRAGRVLVVLAAAGYVVAGLAPADAHENVHVVLGTVPIFFAGNLGLLLIAAGAGTGAGLLLVRIAGLVAGGVGLTGAVLFLQHRYLGLGMGGMERVAVLALHAFLLLAAVLVLSGQRKQDRSEPAEAQQFLGAPSTRSC